MESKKIKGKTKKENQKLSANKKKDNPKNINPKQQIKKVPKNEIKPNNNTIEPKQNLEKNELKIELYPSNVPKGGLKKTLLSSVLPQDKLGDSLGKYKKLAFIGSDVPLLNGFYTAHCKHYPIRLKPDDIWLLIVQAFSNHVNANAEQLRKYFVDFEGKKNLFVQYEGSGIKLINQKILEDFSVQINKQMIKYLGEEILQILTSDFTTTDHDSLIISKLSIMGAFQKYFNYAMGDCICGIPYIILEGTAEDFQKIKEKAEKLSKYEFDWYISRIIPHIQKMIDAKNGKVDNDYFRDIIKRNEVKDDIMWGCTPEDEMISNITGWILDFFAYERTEDDKFIRFDDKSLKVIEFNRLASQILTVPFTFIEFGTKNEYKMEYKVGFFGCEQNEKKEVYPIQAWIVGLSTLEIRCEEFEDPIPPKSLENQISVEKNNEKELEELMKSLDLKGK